MSFSQRQGIAPAKKAIQCESIDDDLRSSIWSLLTIAYWDTYQRPDRFDSQQRVRNSNLWELVQSLWINYFKRPVDTIDTFWPNCHQEIREYFFSAPWNEVFDFIEFVADSGPTNSKERFMQVCNHYLEKENSAYRFVGGLVTEITSEEEIAEIDHAASAPEPFGGARTHIRAALTLLSDRKSPDYRNSIKESISAVESLARQLSDSPCATLGAILKDLERSKELHPALKNAFSSLYGYTNDANGIRHALMDEASLDKADARFMLICCSAFINYCIAHK